MELIRTVKVKLNAKVEEIRPIVSAYTNAFNFICKESFDNKNYNTISIHNLTYDIVKKYLPAQLTISARMKAMEAVKSVVSKKAKKKKKYTTCPNSKGCAVRLDKKKAYTLNFKKKEVSIISLKVKDGRKKYPLIIPDYYKEYFEDNSWVYGSADLIIKKNTVFLHISFKKEMPNISVSGKLLGIDRGINNIAVTSDGKFYTGKKVKKVSYRYRTLRKALGKVNTKSAKRHLKKISGEEKRFKADINHQIAKKIISSLNFGDIIVLEDLVGIRDNSFKLKKPIRTLVNTWNFYQLEQFLVYKGMAKGIQTIHVSAKNTSRKCSCCGFVYKSNRKDQSHFECKACGFRLNADLNASRNICKRASERYTHSDEVVINQPIVAIEILAASPTL